MLASQLFIEFIGTYVLCSIILSNPKPIPIGLAVTNMIYLDNGTSGAHFNPAVSTMFLFRGKINVLQYFCYIIVQLTSGITAHFTYKFIINKENANNNTIIMSTL
jgi:glycerol uptake facilitator-like aquaporin